MTKAKIKAIIITAKKKLKLLANMLFNPNY